MSPDDTFTDNNPANNIDPNGMETYYGDEARSAFSQLQSQMASRPPDEYYVDASGNKTKTSNKGGSTYDYYHFAAGSSNPLSGKTLAVTRLGSTFMGLADNASDLNFYVSSGPTGGRIDQDLTFESFAIG